MEFTKEFDSCGTAFDYTSNREDALQSDALNGGESEVQFDANINNKSDAAIVSVNSNETNENKNSSTTDVSEFIVGNNLNKESVTNEPKYNKNTRNAVASTETTDCGINNKSTETSTGIRLRKREKKVVEVTQVDVTSSDGSEFEKLVKRGRKRRVKTSLVCKNNASEKVKRKASKVAVISDPNNTKVVRKGKNDKTVSGENEKKSKEKVKSKSSKCQVFFCEKCDKVYDQYSELVYHERRHTGEKPFLCTWPGCKKAFSASNARVRHMRTHTGEKPYVCPLPDCGRRFTYWKDLKLHKYRHSGEKPHKCDWEGCSARFFRKDDLKHHRYTHTGEKPYKCVWPGCGAAFSQKSPLNLHVRKTHKNESVTKNAVVATNCQNTPSFVLLPNYQQQTLPSITSSNVQYTHQSLSTSVLANQSQSPFNTSVIGVAATADNENPVLLTCRVSPQNIPQTQNISSGFFASVNPWNSQQTYQSVTQEHMALRQLQSNFEVPRCISSETTKTSQTTASSLHHILACEQVGQQSSCASSSPVSTASNVETTVKNYSRNSKVVDGLIGAFPNANKPKLREVSLGPDSVEFRTISENSTTKSALTPSSTAVALPAESGETIANDSNTAAIPIPVRKRANYRLKVQSPDAMKTATVVSKITIRKQARKMADDSATKKAAKRTIAVQTMKRSIQRSEKGVLHECDICKRQFKAKHDRDCHRMTHTGEKPRACDWPGCDYRCITKSKLIRHKRKHTGERNYPCDWPGCEKKFATSRHMKEHKRSHTGEKPFKCDWPGCDKWFSRKDHIKNHRYTHTGEKPRKCPFPGCESAFIQLSPLKKHMELHKRDGGCVPNRTRKRKVANTNDDNVKNSNPVINNQSITVSNDSAVLPSISQHNTALQNFDVINVHDSGNCCISGYDTVNPQIHLDYEMILRPNYC